MSVLMRSLARAAWKPTVLRPRFVAQSFSTSAEPALDLNTRVFTPTTALEVLRKISPERKFDETFEVEIRLNLDVRQADQIIRSNATLPHDHGKEKVRVIVFAEPEKAAAARDAGAQVAGLDDVIQRIRSKQIKLQKTDKVLATPETVKKVKKEIAKILGPKGLMPNPKLGTVTEDVASAVQVFKHRNILLRTGKFPIVHAGIGKMSFSDEVLLDNLRSLMLAIRDNKPSGAKGKYITGVSIKTSMSPAVNLDVAYADPSSVFFMRDERIKTA